MVKRLFLFMLIFTFSMTVISVDAYAQPKMDIANFLGRTKQWLSEQGRKAQKIGEKVKKFVQEKILGNVSEAKDIVKDGKDKVDNVKDKADNTKEKLAPALEAQALKAKKSEISSKYDQEALVVEEKYNSWFEASDKELAAAREEKDLSLIEDLEKDRAVLVSDKANELAVLQNERDLAMEVVDKELLALAEKTAEDNKGVVEDYFADGKDKPEVPNPADLQTQYFAEVESSENQLIIREVRNQLAARDVVYYLDTSLKILSEIPAEEKKIEELNTGVLTVEYSPSINVSVQMDIEIMSNMIKNMRLRNTNSRKDATKDLAKSSDVKSNPGTVDIQSFDIDDYSYARNCKPKGLINKVKGFGEKVKEDGIFGINLEKAKEIQANSKEIQKEISNAKI